MKYLTKKQVAAFMRKLDVRGEGVIKQGHCRIVSKHRVTICRDKKGYYVSDSFHARGRARGASRSRRLSMYYQD